MLIEMMAYATAQLQWYLDRVASDCFLETARTTAAVNRIVKQLGYKMHPAAAASTLLTLTFPDGTPGPFTMPARWRFQGPNGLIFESYAPLVEPVALPPGAVRIVRVREGETRILTFTGTGKANQPYALATVPEGKCLADQSVEGWVDGLEWPERAFLTYAADEQFEVDYPEVPPVVRFGDGIAGLMPPAGAEVKFRFVVISGAKGNEPKAHSITSSIDTLNIGGTTVTMEVDNVEAPSGGVDAEAIDHARRLAPLSFAARGAAITAQDYDALSNSFSDPLYGAVAKAYAFNPRGTYADLTFNLLVEEVEAYLDAYIATVSALEADIAAGVATITPLAADIQTAMTELEALRTDMVAAVGGAKTSATSARGNCTTAESAITAIDDPTVGVETVQKTLLEDLYAYVDTYVPAIAATPKARILADLTTAILQSTSVLAQAASAKTAVQTASTALDTIVSSYLNPVMDDLTNAAPVAPDTSVRQVEADVLAAVSTMAASLSTIDTKALLIVGTAEALQIRIVVKTNEMRVRIAQLFSDDCMSNYVQVPILSINADGDYVAPSVGLRTGLQAYLDTIKEVTQQVEVVDGSPALVQAIIEIELLIGPAYVYDEEAAKVQAATIALLKGRDFNQPLYLSDLHRTVEAASTGMMYANVKIVGPVGELDADGNLVPDPNRIIKLAPGGLTITQLYE
jgi:hypothetical protein